MERARALCAALLVVIGISLMGTATAANRVYGWSIMSHQIVTKYAIELLPEKWRSFFEYYGALINDTTAYPDTYYREADPNEASRHYIDLEIWNPNETSTGILPQSVVEFTEKMKQAIAAGDWNNVFLIVGRVAHYMADAAQPYHTTVNYDPQGPNGTYLHAVLDSSMADHISEIKLVNSTVVGNLTPIENLTSFVLDTVRQSHFFLSIINRTLIDEAKTWTPELTTIVENRTNTAIIAVARVWYTAIVGTDVSPMPVPSENTLSISIENITIGGTEPSSIRLRVTDKLGVRTNADVFLRIGNSVFRGQVANVVPPIGEYLIVFESQNSGIGTVNAEREGYESVSIAIVLQVTHTTSATPSSSGETIVQSTQSAPPVALVAAVVFLVTLAALVLYRRMTRGN